MRPVRPFGRQPPSKVAKIVKNRRFCRLSAGRCGQAVRPTGLGHMSLDSAGHGPSLLFCKIFFSIFFLDGTAVQSDLGQKSRILAVFRRPTAGEPAGRQACPAYLWLRWSRPPEYSRPESWNQSILAPNLQQQDSV